MFKHSIIRSLVSQKKSTSFYNQNKLRMLFNITACTVVFIYFMRRRKCKIRPSAPKQDISEDNVSLTDFKDNAEISSKKGSPKSFQRNRKLGL